MKPKKILRFYFGAASLERALDNLIKVKAFDFCSDTLETAEKLCAVIGEKMGLERLWSYLDGVISTFSDDEREVLSDYAMRRTPLKESERKPVKRAVIKFTRRARRLCDFKDGISVLKKYYSLIKV